MHRLFEVFMIVRRNTQPHSHLVLGGVECALTRGAIRGAPGRSARRPCRRCGPNRGGPTRPLEQTLRRNPILSCVCLCLSLCLIVSVELVGVCRLRVRTDAVEADEGGLVNDELELALSVQRQKLCDVHRLLPGGANVKPTHPTKKPRQK